MKKVTDTSKKPMLNWLFGGNPKAIEDQEAEGQKELVESSQLPVKVNTPRGVSAQEQYKAMGIKVISTPGPSDDVMFLDVELPEGWEIKATGHSMWSELRDNKGRKRASIFYKAAFYDRSSHINFLHRINYQVDRLGFLQGDYSTDSTGEYNSYKTPFVGRVIDHDGTVLFETEYFPCTVEYNEDRGRGYTKAYSHKSDEIQKKLINKCLHFLTQNYPNYKNINAYWD